MSSAATEAITPAVLEQRRAAIASMPVRDRPSFGDAQCVLRHLARWARGDEVDDAVSQIAAGTLLTQRVVQRSLRALEVAGLIVVLAHGGGRGQRRGTRRRLLHDAELMPRSAAPVNEKNSNRLSGTSSNGTHAAPDPNSYREQPNSYRATRHTPLSSAEASALEWSEQIDAVFAAAAEHRLRRDQANGVQIHNRGRLRAIIKARFEKDGYRGRVENILDRYGNGPNVVDRAATRIADDCNGNPFATLEALA